MTLQAKITFFYFAILACILSGCNDMANYVPANREENLKRLQQDTAHTRLYFLLSYKGKPEYLVLDLPRWLNSYYVSEPHNSADWVFYTKEHKEAAIVPIIWKQIAAHIEGRGYTPRQKVQLVMAICQALPYRSDSLIRPQTKEYPEYPAETVFSGSDCDGKCTLAASIIDYGIAPAYLVAIPEITPGCGHMVIAVDLGEPLPGETYYTDRETGRALIYCDPTWKDYKVGQFDESCNKPAQIFSLDGNRQFASTQRPKTSRPTLGQVIPSPNPQLYPYPGQGYVPQQYYPAQNYQPYPATPPTMQYVPQPIIIIINTTNNTGGGAGSPVPQPTGPPPANTWQYQPQY